MQLKDKTILFLGDSITEGVGASCVENAYWQVFGRLTGAKVVGYGISGTRIAKQKGPEQPDKESFGLYFSSRVEGMQGTADGVVIFGGTNDWGHGDAPLGTMADRTEDTFTGALHCLYTKLLEKYPAAEIVVMTPLHRGDEGAAVNAFGIRNVGTLEEYVNRIREVAAFYGLPVLDLYRVSGINTAVPVIRETYLPDGLHPSDIGHARIASRLAGFMKNL